MYNEIYVIILHYLHGSGARGRGFIVIGVLHIHLCQLLHEVTFLLGRHLFVSPLNVLLLLGLRESWCRTTILGTTMPDSSEPAMAMALLTRWPTNNDDEEEDELNYVPCLHLTAPSLLSPLSPPRSSFSCPASSTLPATAVTAASSFPPGDHCARHRHHWPPAPPDRARESGTAALMTCRCDGRPLPRLPPPHPRQGQMKGRRAWRGTVMPLPAPP
jgi:hypothetical protein